MKEFLEVFLGFVLYFGLIFGTLFWYSSEQKSFSGYIVCKEYIPSHMSNEDVKSIQEASIFIPNLPKKRIPKYIPPKYTFYVANKNKVKSFDIDSLTYLKYSVGQKIMMKY